MSSDYATTVHGLPYAHQLEQIGPARRRSTESRRLVRDRLSTGRGMPRPYNAHRGEGPGPPVYERLGPRAGGVGGSAEPPQVVVYSPRAQRRAGPTAIPMDFLTKIGIQLTDTALVCGYALPSGQPSAIALPSKPVESSTFP